MRGAVSHRGLLVAAAVALVVGAGCMATIGEKTKDALGVNDTSSEDQATEAGSLEASYGDAFDTLEEDGAVSRWSMDLHTEAVNGSSTTDAKLLVDEELPMLLVSLRESGAEIQATDEGPLLVGQVGKTSLMGSPEELVGMYNESQSSPTEDFESPSLEPPGGEDGGSQDASRANPMTLVDAIDELPDEAEFSREPATVDGEDAVRVDVAFDNGTHSFDFTATVYTDPPRPASIEGTFDGPEMSLSGSGPAEVSITFAYGEDAEHPHERKVVRAEAVTFFDEETFGSMELGSQGAGDEWTIQPSVNPGSVDLSEVRILVTNSSGFEGDTEAVLTLDPREGSASNDQVSVSYEDADGDGAVSPGDTITLEPQNENATGYSVAVEDQVTGVRTVPGPGAAFPLLAGVALAVARRR